MRITELIEKKKNGMPLSKDEIYWIISGYTCGSIEDYHMSALLMAICFQGMNEEETANMTYAMADSGEKINLDRFGDLSADKHSTGGVGDKTSLIIAPIVASLGAKIAKMSGRGLGHTGGTIDKLESIPGYKTTLSFDEFIEIVDDTGLSIIGSMKNLAPADKKIYALRDVTATVDCIPLISSSVMSKKIAAGAKNIVIDVKCGSGAFMKNRKDALVLANSLVSIGKYCNRNISAVITNMDTPLGYAIGNSLEVAESIEVLRGNGPKDLRDICIELSANLLELIFGADYKDKVIETLNSGKAFEYFENWITKQGGRLNDLITDSKYSTEVICTNTGYINSMNSKMIGETAMILGAGRNNVNDSIDHSSGIILKKKTGDFVQKGDTLAIIQSNNENSINTAYEMFQRAITISSTAPIQNKLIYEIIK